jgi:hypothetical protein
MADALEARLTTLGDALRFPRIDSLADDVVAELAAPPPASIDRRRWRRPLLAAAALLLVIATVVLAVPASRRTIAGWLGFDGLRIERVELVPPTVTVPVTTLPPDEIVDAATRVGVEPLVAPALGPPRAVSTPLDRYLLVRYDEAVLVTLPGDVATDLFFKMVDAGAEVRTIELFGAPAYWISGGSHFFVYRDADGEVREARPAGSTLVWERGDDIVRIEGDLTLQRAVEIASSVQPV